jgi:hypothetical protein
MYTTRIVTYYVNNKNRTLACVYTRAHTSSLRNIDNLVRLLRPAAIFSPSSVCMCVKEKKRKIFVLLKELACTHLLDECMYVCVEEKKVHAFGREVTTIM